MVKDWKIRLMKVVVVQFCAWDHKLKTSQAPSDMLWFCIRKIRWAAKKLQNAMRAYLQCQYARRLTLCKKWELLREANHTELSHRIRRDTHTNIQKSKELDTQNMDEVQKALHGASERLKCKYDERDSITTMQTTGEGAAGEQSKPLGAALVRKQTFSDMADAARQAKRASARVEMERSYKMRRNEFVLTYIRQERLKVCVLVPAVVFAGGQEY
jgi:hypothetical protein